MSKGHLGSSVGKTVPAQKVREFLRRAAAHMDSTAQAGACLAILRTRAGLRTSDIGFNHFYSMFKQSGLYWFGQPQCWLDGEEERSTRQHRVYALLLAAESIE